ncbi:MAG: glycosyltransferase family 2 protein [Spirosomataceae bacterium]
MQALPTSSIALCTYNGAQFLDEQLQSFVQQTQLPSELIVCDDNSTDDTLEVVRNFQKTAPFPVQIYQNSASLGVVKNFEKAASLCTKEIIFFSDQDDIWLPQKIKNQSVALQNSPKLGLIFCNAEIVSQSLQSLGRSMWEEVRFRPIHQQQWLQGDAVGVLLQGNRVSGCTIAIRNKLLQKLLPFPTSPASFIHDAYLALCAALLDSAGFINESLVLYRQHQQQQIGTRPTEKKEEVKLASRFSRDRADKLQPLLAQAAYFEAVYQQLPPLVQTTKAVQILQKAQHLHTRGSLPQNRLLRVGAVLVELLSGHYQQYKDPDANWYAGILAAIGDLVE